MRYLKSIIAIAIFSTLAACTANPTPRNPPAPPAQPTTIGAFVHTAFIAALRAKGYLVENTGTIEQPFFRAKGVSLRVSGGNLTSPVDLQSFDYADAKTAGEDSSQIEPDGNPRTMRISWIAPPHFFRKDRVVVVYVGSDASALAALTELLGAQFAGK